MKKLQKARMALSVTVAGFTGSSIVLIREQIITASRQTGVIATQATDNSLEKNLLLFFILVTALFVTYFLFKWLATLAFIVEWIRKLILRRDYVEGYWLVENRIKDHLISTGFMHYKIINEQLSITGEHFSSFNGKEESKMIFKSTSRSADCFKGKYYNCFDMANIGPGVAVGHFSSKGHGGGIPDGFEVQVIVATTPDRIFNWGQNTPLWTNDKTHTGYVIGFSNLPPKERKTIIDLMVKDNVVTMDQCGIRISKKEVDKAEKEDSNNYKRVLAKKHYEKLQRIANNA